MTLTSTQTFIRTSPEAEGIPSGAVLAFIDAVEQHEHPLDAVQGFMLLRHGNVAAEGWWAPYGPDRPHSLFSLSKSFTSTAIGLAVAEGLLTVDDPVLSFFPDDAPESPSSNLKAMTVKHLLSMNTGHHEDTTGAVWGGKDENWPRAFLSLPIEHDPGTWFVYNTAATYMLSAIITQLTGEILVDYLQPRLFDPLGIPAPFWEADPRGRSIGGSGLHLRTEDIARFGQMYLQQGVWNGQQVVSSAWIAEASAAHSDNSNTQTNPDWSVGYGYQFWRCRHNAYRGDGAFGQYCVVMPGQDAVLAINSGLRDMQRILDLVWEHLLPAMGDSALPEDPAVSAALTTRLESLTLPVPTNGATFGHSGKIVELESNPLGMTSVRVDAGKDAGTITIGTASGEQVLTASHGSWQEGRANLRPQGDEPVAASGGAQDASAYEFRLCFLESESCTVARLVVDGGSATFELTPNVSWGSAETTTIAGRVQS